MMTIIIIIIIIIMVTDNFMAMTTITVIISDMMAIVLNVPIGRVAWWRKKDILGYPCLHETHLPKVN